MIRVARGVRSLDRRREWAEHLRTATSLRPAALRQRLAEFQSLRKSLFEDGGHSIESPPGRAGDDAPWHLRTTIQPDGDVVWLVHTSVQFDRAVLAAHADVVAQWYDGADATMTTLRVYFRTLSLTGSGVVGLLAGAGTIKFAGGWGAAASVVVPVLATPVARYVTGWVLRRGMKAWI